MEKIEEHAPPSVKVRHLLEAIVLLCLLSAYALAIVAAGPQGIILGWRFAGYLLVPAVVSFLFTFLFKKIIKRISFRKWLPLIAGLPVLVLAGLEFFYYPVGFKAITASAGILVLVGVRPVSTALSKYVAMRVIAFLIIGFSLVMSFATDAPQYFDFLFV